MQSCYALVRSVTKPRQPGGLSHVKIPNPENTHWESIYEPRALEKHILKQHRKHFSQAAGTIFTRNPLRTLINDKCTSNFAKQVLAGTANLEDLSIDDYTKDLLRHLKTKVSPTENPANPLDSDDLIQGFKRWPEKTTTSPSGRHLGIYKSLAKHFPPPKDKNNPEPFPEPQEPVNCGNNILKLLIMMMDLAVTTYDRWKTIWTLLLEKDTGDPKID